MPTFDEIGDHRIETGERECAVEIEPDEAVCLASWCIARVYVQGFVRRKLLWFAVPENHPLFREVSDFAMDEHEQALAEHWDDYLADHPIHPVDNHAEHRSHGGSL